MIMLDKEAVMGILKSLFGTQNSKQSKTKIEVEIDYSNDGQTTKKLSTEIQELIMLFYSEKYKVGEKNYPQYLLYDYGIAFPDEVLRNLQQKDLIRIAKAKESLHKLKLSELKTIASNNGLKTTGKKESIVNELKKKLTDEDAERYISDRYWMPTERGAELLETQAYIGFYLEKHPYSLREIGLDISEYAKLFSKSNNRKVRDVLWGEFNRMSIDLFSDGLKNNNFHQYCSLIRVMSLFIEEEERHKDALAEYIRYLFYRSNYHAVGQAFQYYGFTKDFEETVDTLFSEAQIYPFNSGEIMQMSNACGFDSSSLQLFIKETLDREPNPAVFTSDELTALILAGIKKDDDEQRQICKKVLSRRLKTK